MNEESSMMATFVWYRFPPAWPETSGAPFWKKPATVVWWKFR